MELRIGALPSTGPTSVSTRWPTVQSSEAGFSAACYDRASHPTRKRPRPSRWDRLRARADPARLPPGTVVGRYEIVGELGAGGMAVVYRARDRELSRDVALKLLASAEDASQGNTRLLREAQALAQLAHPNVIHVYDVGRFSDGVFLAMELVEGLRLDEWLRQRPRRLDELLPVFRDAARGLSAAHARGIVHRDFKPSNLILGADGRVRVLDFGLARAADSPDGDATCAHNDQRGAAQHRR